MKRALFDTVKVIPYTSGDTIDRNADGACYLSARLAVQATAAGELTVTVSDCDTENGTFTPVTDPFLLLGEKPAELAANDTANVNIDLEGCRRYLQITSSLAGTCALALGDSRDYPV